MAPTISDNPDCPVCQGQVSALCPACTGQWTAQDLARWCAANGRPAPRPFPAPLASPSVPGDEAQALADLVADLGDLSADLARLDGLVVGMMATAPTACQLRRAAEVADNLGDGARAAARAIWDAIPDQVVPVADDPAREPWMATPDQVAAINALAVRLSPRP